MLVLNIDLLTKISFVTHVGTRTLLAIHLEKEETNREYLILLKQLFERYNSLIEIRTDRKKKFLK